MSSRWYPGNSGDIFPKAWFQHLLRESTSSWLQKRFVHHTIGGIALGSKKRFRSRSYRAYRRNGCSLASPPCKTWSRLFREIRVHYQPRVVRECRRRRPGSQTSRSRPLQLVVVGVRATSLIGGAFQTYSSTCTRSPEHVRVASRLAGRTCRGLSG